MWWLALVFMMGLMALFQVLTRAGPIEARATLALGFLALAAHLGGDLAKRFHLPRITGFLVTGLVVGPAWLGLVRSDEVLALGFIADAAMALVAFAAGSQLTLGMLRRDAVMLARVSVATVVIPFGIVAAVTLSVAPWFPLTVHQPFGDALAVALVLGTIAAAASPTVTMALIEEVDARGPLARAVLGVAVAKDLLVIVVFALVLANAGLFASPGAVDMGVAWTTLRHAAGSIAAGAALGFVVSRYLRLLRRDTPIFVVALAFLTAQVGSALGGGRGGGLETILIALTAGFYVENFAPVEGARLRGLLQRGNLPVYLVVFALAGAGLQLDTLREVWPWVLLLVALRVLGLRLGTRFAGASPSVPPDMASHGWLGLVSQAGIAIGLAAAARRAFPEWGVSLEALVVVMIGVHEIAGPICFRRALRLTGEVTEGEHVTKEPDADRPALIPGGGRV